MTTLPKAEEVKSWITALGITTKAGAPEVPRHKKKEPFRKATTEKRPRAYRVKQISQMLRAGLTRKDIAKHLGLSVCHVYDLTPKRLRPKQPEVSKWLPLMARHKQITELQSKGYTNVEIARRLKISTNRVFAVKNTKARKA